MRGEQTNRYLTKRTIIKAFIYYASLSMFIFALLLFSLQPVLVQAEYASNKLMKSSATEPGSQRDIAIRVGFEPYLPPFQYKNGEDYEGFNIDILNAVADIENIKVELVPLTISAAIEALAHGEIDVILGIPYKANYYEEMEFTERYFTSSISMLVPQHSSIVSISDLSERIVGLQRETLEYDFLHNIRRVKYNATSNQHDAFQLLLLGRVDAFVGNQSTAEYLLNQYGLSEKYVFVDRHILPFEYTMAVHYQNFSLLQILNHGLHQVKVQGHYKQIYDRWFLDESSNLRQRLQTLIQLFAAIGTGVLALFFLGIRWNRQLKKQVEMKTEDLLLVNQSLALQVQETRNSQQLKEQILDSSPRGVVTIDLQGMITSMNPRAMQLANITRKPVAQDYRSVPLLAELLTDRFERVMLQGKQFHGEIKPEQSNSQDEHELYLRFYAYPLFDYQQNIIGTILSFEDITEERKLREQVFEQEKSRALSQLVAGIAHEIRNPLTSIKTFVELIPLKANNSRFQEEMSRHVPQEIERLNQLIEGLIDYAKPRNVLRERVNVAELIQSSILLFLRAVENKGFSIVTELEPELSVMVDPNRLKQVMINLILNSIESLEEKYKESPANLSTERIEGNKINIRTWSRTDGNEERVFIQVQDQGIGMSESQIKRVLEPFYTTKAQGTGLGLALSQQYIQENGGTMNIESQVGKGTTITLSFRKEEYVYDKLNESREDRE